MKGERKMKYYQTLNLYQEDSLLIDEEAVLFAAKASEYGNVYGVDGAGLADLPTLNDITISDEDTVADVAAAVNGMVYYMHTDGCRCGEALDIEGFDIVYCHELKEFMAVSDMAIFPVYIYREGNDFRFIWLSEPEAIVEVEEYPDLTITAGAICTEVYPIYQLNREPVENKYLLRRWSQWEGSSPSGEIVSSEELEKIKAGE